MTEQPTALKIFRTRNIILPILISLGYIGWLMYTKWKSGSLQEITWSNHIYFWFAMTLLLLIGRMFFYMWRIKTLSNEELNWKKSFQIISIWEFASALTPSVIGGTAVAMFLLAKEKINLGKSTAIVLLTAFLDEVFFILFAPLLLLIVGFSKMFPDNGQFFKDENLGIVNSDYLFTIFLIGYGILFLYTLLIGYGLFIKPKIVKRILGRIFSIKFLKKWRRSAIKTGIDIEIASKELKGKTLSFWIKSFSSTILAWFCRYFEANFIIIAFAGYHDQLMIFARSFVIWIIMMIPLTPGASGLAESSFLILFKDINAGMDEFIVLFWRAFSYFPYLIIGVLILPRWLKRVYKTDS